MSSLYNYLCHVCGEENVLKDEPLSAHTTFKIGGNAKFFVKVKSREKLLKLISALNFLQQKYFIIGGGSNILANSNGYDGVVIKLMMNEIVYNSGFVYADAGAMLSSLIWFCQTSNLTGFEWAAGIPATVGGAIYMNAGCHGHEIAENTVMVDVLENGEIKSLTAMDLDFSYRESVFKNKRKTAIILGAYFYLKREAPEKIAENVNLSLEKRKNLPKAPSAGSVFKKPSADFFVGKEIEALGLKGLTVGGAQISPEHAGFIVNNGEATSADVHELIKLIKEKIKAEKNIDLETEIIKLE
ncbi:MAG: UDP-N-acetylmuramate dehydrogenase [Christensenellaceae bacterium]|jgi:UDP-N-acetylmuramate dehydrogenase|nr:UDP-N-acetylmuramate dehydrogenase [Christensenellaceae bacterium]